MATATLPGQKAKRIWTYDEMLAELPETSLPAELWDGELIMAPTPSPSHQSIVLRFTRLLDDFVRGKKSGTVFVRPLDVVLSQHRVVQPDVLYVAKENRGIIQDRIRGVPDLVAEVVSQTWKRDRVEKKALYEQVGISEYWIIDPEAGTVEVFALIKGVYQLHAKAAQAAQAKSRLLPGFRVSFRDLQA